MANKGVMEFGLILLSFIGTAISAPHGRLSALAKVNKGNPAGIANGIKGIKDEDLIAETEIFLRERGGSEAKEDLVLSDMAIGAELPARVRENSQLRKQLFDALLGVKGSPAFKEAVVRKISRFESKDPGRFSEYQSLLRRIHASTHSSSELRVLALSKLRDPSDENIGLLLQASGKRGSKPESDAALSSLAKISGTLSGRGDKRKLAAIAQGIAPLLEGKDMPPPDALRISMETGVPDAKARIAAHFRRGKFNSSHVFAVMDGADESLVSGILEGSVSTMPSEERAMQAAVAMVMEKNPGAFSKLRSGAGLAETEAFIRNVKPICDRAGFGPAKESLSALLSHGNPSVRIKALEACVACGLDAQSIKAALASEKDKDVREAMRYFGLGE